MTKRIRMPTFLHQRRKATSLAEILVVLLVLSALLALLLPAVQSARERARQLACQSNCRNFALAMIQGLDASGRLPENRFELASNGQAVKESLWFDRISLFLELPSVQPGGPSSAYQVLSCPSAPPVVGLSPLSEILNGPNSKNLTSTTTDYVGCSGINSLKVLGEAFPAPESRTGVVCDLFGKDRARYVSEVVGGRSQTICCWEAAGSQLRFLSHGDARPTYKDWAEQFNSYRICSDLDASKCVAVRSLGSTLRYIASTAGRMNGYIGWIELSGQPLRNPVGQPLSTRVVNVTNGHHGPYTFHVSTFSAGFLDGSVRSIHFETDAATLFQMATICDDGSTSLDANSQLQ